MSVSTVVGSVVSVDTVSVRVVNVTHNFFKRPSYKNVRLEKSEN